MTEMWELADAHDRAREREFRAFICQNADRIDAAIRFIRQAQGEIAKSWGIDSDYWRKLDEVAEQMQSDLDEYFTPEP